MSSLGVACGTGEPPIFEGTSAERDAVAGLRRELPARFLAVHPGSGSAAKSWPADRFARLVHELGQDRFLLVEGPADAVAAAAVRAGGAVVARGLPPRALGALLADATAFVGNDSGVIISPRLGRTHGALFGPTDPDGGRRWDEVKVVRAPADAWTGSPQRGRRGAPLLTEAGSELDEEPGFLRLMSR